MLQPLGQKLYFKLYSIKRKWQPPNHINIGKELQHAKHVFLCFPSDSEGHRFAQQQLGEFRKIFKNARITILHNESQGIKNMPGLCHALSYGNDDFNMFGLPKKAFSKSVFDRPIDAFFDLNRNSDTKATLFACYSNAKLCIGFDHEYSSFYNFVIRFHSNQGWQEYFMILFKYVLGIQCRIKEPVVENP